MKIIKVEDAVGTVLCHDMTQIIKDGFKGPRFRKGHVIKQEDIPVLLDMGKDHIYVFECGDDQYHENDAALHLAEICKGNNTFSGDIVEGKISIFSQCDGVLKIDIDLLNKINGITDIMIATKYNNTPVKKNNIIAGTRVIPLVVAKSTIERAEKTAGSKKIIQVLPYKGLRAGIVTTGNEVYYGRIKDQFTDVIRNKIKAFEITEIGHRYSKDPLEEIEVHIKELIDEGANIIFCSGGMSVDPDDNTPGAIKAVATDIVTYGAPVLPGAMFMLAYYNDIPIIGLPGCVMFSKQTVFDLVLPRLAAGEKVTKQEIVALGNGGLL
ncbi:MAG: molybdopterin-binding protein [Tissierellia bacterium]|nr:molybdopterin-binding protein [Tissierellia bacterium]